MVLSEKCFSYILKIKFLLQKPFPNSSSLHRNTKFYQKLCGVLFLMITNDYEVSIFTILKQITMYMIRGNLSFLSNKN